MNIPASVNNSYDLELDELEADTIYTTNLYLNNVDINTLLNDTSTTTGMQNEINDLQTDKADKTYVDTQDYNLQTQITENTNKNSEQDIRLNNIETKNTSQDNSITSINNSIITINNKNTTQDNSITSLNTSISSINSTNSNQNSRLDSIENSAIYSLVSGTITANTLGSGSNATASLTITNTTSANSKLLNFTFGIPRGNTGQQGIQGPTGPSGISFIWKDTWTNPYSYYKNDVCYWDGSSYICLGHKDNRNNPVIRDVNPSDNPDEWVKMCQKGDTGEKGSTGDSGLNEFLGALGIAISGTTALAQLAEVFNITQTASDLQDGIDDLGNDLDNSNQRIAELENKTQNQSAIGTRTTFNNLVDIQNPATLTSQIQFDGSTGQISATACEIQTGEFNNINTNHNVYIGENLTGLGNVNLGTSSVSSVNINSLSTNINGLVYINGVQYLPFIPTNFFSQW